MKRLITAASAQGKFGAIAGALLAAAAVGGLARPMFAASPAAVENPAFEIRSAADQRLPPGGPKAGLIGSYAVTGTDPAGKPYAGTQVVDIALAPSGALELVWDNGRSVGVGEVISNTLAVASWTKGRTVIFTMNVNPDGSLSGKWLRRTDRGAKGTERWNRKS